MERNFGALGGGTDFHFDDPDTIKPEYKPESLPQVMQCIERAAAHDANAKDVFETVTSIENERAAKAKTTDASASDATAADAGATAHTGVAASSTEPETSAAATN